MGLYVGYDIGSISVNRAIINEKKEIVEILPYARHFGEPVKSVKKDIESMHKGSYKDRITGIYFTGSGGKDHLLLLFKYASILIIYVNKPILVSFFFMQGNISYISNYHWPVTTLYNLGRYEGALPYFEKAVKLLGNETDS
ncbi:unnamed protein product [marine sediment metagenome]|uniref:Uncharacterized protein n=1 Tax=marine sediment metagenome TaxID=412755 RepID=X1JKE8_9ZZZZ